MTSVTWETASDLDGGSDDGTVHESTSNTDHNDDTLLKRGYPYGSFDEISPNPKMALPFHEDSGTTANDLSGNGNDGTYNDSPTLGVTGLLGTTAVSLDGSDDDISFPNLSLFSGGNDYTITFWVNFDNTGNKNWIWAGRGEADVHIKKNTNDQLAWAVNDGGGISSFSGSTSISSGEWVFGVGVWDADSNKKLYLNGSEDFSGSISDPQSKSLTNRWGEVNFEGNRLTGDLYDGRVYASALSSSEIQTLYEVVDKPGIHHSSTKTA